ncbi:MAG: hypothetical protein WDZ72_03235 [Cyclobacteriaceae bacterium]
MDQDNTFYSKNLAENKFHLTEKFNPSHLRDVIQVKSLHGTMQCENIRTHPSECLG